jgi:hypothetical protein
VARLDYRQGDYCFQFSSYEMGAYCCACPGRQQFVEHDHPRNWSEQVVCFRNWVGHLAHELTCHDPWEELAKYRLPIDGADQADARNETISGVEAQAIAQQVSALAEAIEASYDLTPEQRDFVREKLAYLAEAAMREKSGDWALSALGVCATLAMALSLDEDGAARLWRMLRERVGEFVRLSRRKVSRPVFEPTG